MHSQHTALACRSTEACQVTDALKHMSIWPFIESVEYD